MLERYAPVTDSFGFLKAPIEPVVAFMDQWLVPQDRTPAEWFEADLETALSRIVPGSYWPILVVETKGEWTAVFKEHGPPIAHVSHNLPCRGVMFTYVPDSYDPSTDRGRMGAIQLQMYEPHDTFFLNNGRAISLTKDVDKWEFETSYDPLPFEDLERSEAKDARERFTFKMLKQYASALGIEPYEPEFYGTRCAFYPPPAGIS